MPRKAREMNSRFEQVQKQAQQLLANLRREIRSKEDELRRLKDEDLKLAGLLGQQRPAAAARQLQMAVALARLESIGDASWNRCRSSSKRPMFTKCAKLGISDLLRFLRRLRGG